MTVIVFMATRKRLVEAYRELRWNTQLMALTRTQADRETSTDREIQRYGHIDTRIKARIDR